MMRKNRSKFVNFITSRILNYLLILFGALSIVGIASIMFYLGPPPLCVLPSVGCYEERLLIHLKMRIPAFITFIPIIIIFFVFLIISASFNYPDHFNRNGIDDLSGEFLKTKKQELID